MIDEANENMCSMSYIAKGMMGGLKIVDVRQRSGITHINMLMDEISKITGRNTGI
jgi:hypothetical protein